MAYLGRASMFFRSALSILHSTPLCLSLRPLNSKYYSKGDTASSLLRQLGYQSVSFTSCGKLVKRPPSKSQKRLTLEIDGRFTRMDSVFLRDACNCSLCIDPSTQQKLFQTTDIPLDVYPERIERFPDGSYKILWSNDISRSNDCQHESYYSPKFLQRYSSLRERVRARWNNQPYILWDKQAMEKEVLWVDYDHYLSSDKTLFEVLKNLSLYGLIFVRGIPDNHNAVELIAERIGNIKNTFYGMTWDVKSMTDSKNIAYTSLDLGLHMDLLYFESPPGLQFLHCIRNSAVGGSSVFADSFRAATIVRANSPMLFNCLASFPVTFHYVNDGHHYHFARPTVVLDEHSYLNQKHLSHVNWAPPFQAPFEVDTAENSVFRTYLSAAKEFAAKMDDPESQFELRLGEGECVVFCNRRVVHSRREFDPTTGDRWLKGTYVDIDTFQSKYRSMREIFRDEDQYSYIK